jgi:hypothetical protein
VPALTDDKTSTSKPVEALVCVECGDEDAEAGKGWHAYVFEDALLVYCPTCAEREFEPFD